MLLPDRPRRQVTPWLISYATGTLLGAAFLGMIPEAMSERPPLGVSAAILGGVLAFLALERLLIWRHCHDGECEVHGRAGVLILIGDAFHNFIDGVVIAAAFLVSVPLGIAVSLAVIAHEIPQEVGDFAILLDSGYQPRNAFLLNTLSASATLPGAILGYLWLPAVSLAIPYVLAVSAASFLYIALADLVPTLHKRGRPHSAILHFGVTLAGVATIALLHRGH
jgi:zinc and cadmium transporter